MSKIKNLLSMLLTLGGLFILLTNYKEIQNVITNYVDKAFETQPHIIIKEGNEFSKQNTFLAVQQTNDYIPYSYNDLINIFYSILNQGWDDFTFYCPPEYTTCISDVSKLSNDEQLLGNINNYVHPFNSYTRIKTSYDETGEINVSITKLYTKEEQQQIIQEKNSIINKLNLNTKTQKEQIKSIHDYIINTTKYDKNKADGYQTNYDSSRIGGVLFDHYSVCAGYADTLALFLSDLNIPNFKVSSATHVWNVAYVEGKWLHIDATWDDPVSETNQDFLTHTYFLLTTNELLEKLESYEEHNFDISFYKEIKMS